MGCMISAISYASDINSKMYLSPWSFDCSVAQSTGNKVCVFERSMFEDESRKVKIASIVFSMTNAKGSPQLSQTIVSPLGTLLTPGVTILIGDKATTLPFIFCDQRGCFSQTIVDNKNFERLTKSKEVKLQYKLPTSQDAQIIFSLNGFQEAFESTKKQLSH